MTVGIKFTCITSLIHTLSDKVGFVNNNKTELEEVLHQSIEGPRKAEAHKRIS